MARAKPYCPDCIQDPTLTAGPQGQCQHVYDLMDECMKAHRGNVADRGGVKPSATATSSQSSSSSSSSSSSRQQQQTAAAKTGTIWRCRRLSAVAQASGPYVAGNR